MSFNENKIMSQKNINEPFLTLTGRPENNLRTWKWKEN